DARPGSARRRRAGRGRWRRGRRRTTHCSGRFPAVEHRYGGARHDVEVADDLAQRLLVVAENGGEEQVLDGRGFGKTPPLLVERSPVRGDEGIRPHVDGGAVVDVGSVAVVGGDDRVGRQLGLHGFDVPYHRRRGSPGGDRVVTGERVRTPPDRGGHGRDP